MILDTTSVWNAFRLQPDRLYVIKGGIVTAETRTERRVRRGDNLEPVRFERLPE